MTSKWNLKLFVTVAILLATSVPAVAYAAQLLGLGAAVPSISPVNASGAIDILGIDCGLGAQAPNATGFPSGDNFLDTSCIWANGALVPGDVDGDGFADPLVSDQTTLFTPNIGGGFTAEVRLANMFTGEQITGFDITVSWNTKYLSGVKIDQGGLRFGASDVFETLRVVDNNLGQARLAQAILAGFAVPDSGTCLATPNSDCGVTLFRVRFDVVGVGTSPLTISSDVITNPGRADCGGGCPHKTQSGSFESVSTFDPTLTLGLDVSWSFAPSPPVPGSPLTFTALALCPACGGSFTFSWDTDSNGAPDGAATNPMTVTPPPPIVHRVVLTATAGGHTVFAARLLPLVDPVTGPSPVAAYTSNSYTAKWLGGLVSAAFPYQGSWRFCPAVTAPQFPVCNNAAPALTTASTQIDTKAVTYNFGGVYTNTQNVNDRVSLIANWISTSNTAATYTFFVTVTGGVAAYTVTITTSPVKANVGDLVTITATIKYAGDGALFYDTNGDGLFTVGEPILNGAAPTAGTAGINDQLIKYADANANLVRDGAECIFYDTDNNQAKGATEPTLAGTCPGSGVIRNNDTKIRFVDISGNNAYNAGTILNPGTYPGSPRSSFFDVFFDFGDGQSTTVASGGSANCAVNLGGCVITTTHTYVAAAIRTITATAKETAAAALSKIQETGTGSITINTANPLCSAGSGGCDFTVNPPSPTAGSSATFTVTVNGGTPPYMCTFTWGDGSPNTGPSPCSTGTTFPHTYATKGSKSVNLHITDNVASFFDVTHTVVVNPTIALSATASCPAKVVAGTAFNCTVTATGGTSPYTGTGTISRTIATKTNQAGTTQSFTVTDNNGATFVATSGAIVVNSATPLTVTASCPAKVVAGTAFNCTVSATGGTAPYTGTGTLSRTLSTKTTQTGTTQSFDVTDANGKVATGTSGTIVVNSATPLTATTGGSCPAKVVAGTAFTCTISASGGTAPYTGTGTISRTLSTKTNQAGTVVSFDVTDANGKVATATATVVVNSATALAATAVCPAKVVVGTAFNCTVSAVGGTSPYTGTGSISRTLATKTNQAGATVSFDVTDANGKIATGTATVVVNSATPLTVTASCPAKVVVGTAFNCTVSATGGTAPYTGTGSISRTLATKTNQAGATVSFDVTDANGKLATGTATVVVNSATALAVTAVCPAKVVVGTAFNCTVSAVGGTAPYTGTGTISRTLSTKTNQAGTVVSFDVTDANGKVATGTATVVVNSATALAVTVSCPAKVVVGTAFNCTVSAVGGTSPYTGTGTVSRTLATKTNQAGASVSADVTDANGKLATGTTTVVVNSATALAVTAVCPAKVVVGTAFNCTVSAVGGTSPYTGTGSISRTLSTKTNQAGTTVSFDVTDANGKVATGTATVVVNSATALAVTAVCPAKVVVGTAFNCTVSAVGGTSPYTGTGSISRTLSTKTNQAGATVSFDVTDANGKVATGTANVVVNSATALAVTAVCPAKVVVGTAFNCTVSAVGGTSPYTGTGTISRTLSTKTNQAGTAVSFTVTDANGKQASGSATVVVNSATALAVTAVCPAKVVVGTAFNCTVSAVGGTSPYTGTGSISRTLSTKTNQAGTTVSFDVTDANGKIATGTATVVVNSATPLAVTAVCPAKVVVGTAFNCTVSAVGGTSPYTGTGSISRTLSTKTNQAGTIVSFDVTDANGKVATGTATVVVNSATALAVTASCPAKVVVGTAFNCTVSATGGTSPYTGTGSISRTLATKTNQAGATVSFDVTDANGKLATGTATVVVNSATALAATASCPAKVVVGTAFNCTVTATGGTAPYTGTGTISRTIATKTNQAGTTQSFTVTDANGKTATAISGAIVVNSATPLTVTASCPAKVVVGTAFNCTVSATGGTSPYTGTGTISRTLAAKTTQAGAVVSFDVTDANGKLATGTTTVVVNSATALAVTASCPAKVVVGTAFNCTVSATGGTSPYTGTGTISRTLATKTNQAGTVVSFDVTDANGKIATGTATVVVNSATPLAVTASCPAKVVVGTAFNCTVSATGGTAPYTGTGTISRTLATKTSQAGTVVSFDVTDANGKIATGTATVVVNSATALAVTASCPAKVVVGTAFNCTVSATGGTAPYTGTGTQSRTLSTKTNQAGTAVSFSVTDANGKVASGSATVVVNSATALAVTASCPAKVVVGTAFNCTVSATGGTAPYTGTGSISRTLAAKTTQAGTTVSFDVTDANGKLATGTANVVVNSATPLAVTVSCPAKVVVGTAFNCTVSATGGTSPYTGTGTISRTLAAKSNQAGATVSADVTDANGKLATGTTTVVVNSATPLTVTVSGCPAKVTQGQPFNCTVTATGGTSPYTGTGTQSTSVPGTGTQTVTFTVTDANGKQATGSTTVQSNAPVSTLCTAAVGGCDFTANPAKPTVNQLVTITVTVNGGTPSYQCTITWGDGSPNTGPSPCSTGTTFTHTYTTKGNKIVNLHITDSAATQASFDVAHTIMVNSATPLAVTVACPAKVIVGTAFNCTVSATGGTAPYTGTGTQSSTLSTKTTQAGATVSFDVTDANGKLATGTTNVVVNSATALAVTVSCPAKVVVGTAFNCDVSATGGTSPYTGTGTISRTLSTKTNQAGTAVSFTVTDANGKQASGSATVVVNSATPLAVTASCPAKVVVGTAFNCTVSATGGTAPYTGTGTQSRTLSTKTNQAGTTVSFSVTDANGKVASGSATVVVNSATPLTVTASCPAKVVLGTAFNCTVSATGGTAPYTGAGSISRTLPAKTTQAGTVVSFDVTDANGKVATGTANVVVNSATPLAVVVTCPAKVVVGTAFNCTVDATGGTGPYTGTGTISRTLPAKTNQAGATVSADVTDANGKLATGTTTVVVNSATPLAVTASCPAKVVVGTAFNCTVSATGGTAPYTGTGTISRTLSTKTNQAGTAVSFTVTDANGKQASGSATVVVNSATPLAVSVTCGTATAGKPVTCTASVSGGTTPYGTISWSASGGNPPSGSGTSFTTTYATKNTVNTVTASVTDANGKTASGSATVNVAAQPLIADFTFNPTSPQTGQTVTFTATVSGGTAAYSYSWNFGDGSPAGTGSPVNHVYNVKGPKTVTLTVTDANGATTTATHTVGVTGSAITGDFTFTPASPTVSKPVTFTASGVGGGTPPLTLSWNFGDGSPAGTGSPVTHTYAAKSNAAGYTVTLTITDANTATRVVSHSVVVSGQPLNVVVNCPNSGVTVGKPFICSVSATGGTGPYTGTGNFTRTESTKGMKTETFTVTDANGVSAQGSDTVSVQGQPLTASFTFNPATPTAGKPVSFTATASGGTTPYTFNWSFGDATQGSGATITHSYAAKGSYMVTLSVTDFNGVTVPVQQTVIVTPQPLVADFGVSGAKVNTVATFTAVVSGGTAPYSYTWAFGDGSPLGSGNPVSHTYTSTGTFNVSLSVHDSNNATVTVAKSVDITPPLTSVDFTPTQTLIGDTIFTSIIVGGTPPITCTWTFGDGTPAVVNCGPHVTHTYTVAGTFTVTLTVHDGNNEQLVATHQVTVEQGPTLIRGKVHWTHHLTGGVGAVQTFTAKVQNPSSMTVLATLKIDIFTDGGIFVTTLTCNTSMAPGSTNLSFTCPWTATLTGKFMFTATLLYSIDFGAGQSVNGTDASKSGSFAVVP